MPNALRLDLLRQLREGAGLSQAEMARLCGLHGRQSHQTAGAWERGEYAPDARRRPAMMAYLWDSLGLRRTPARFAEVWAILEDEWGWEPIERDEWQRFSQAPLPAPAAPAVPPPPFQAPADVAHFVGRDSLVAGIGRLLTQGATPQPIALTGMGGIGKTALAIHLAHTLAPAFPDGVLWAHSAISAPRDIAISWAQAYGYDFSGLADFHSAAAALRGLLASRRVLLVFDDVLAAARVQPLLPGGDRAAVLITTRSEDVAATLGAALVPVSELAPAEGLALLVRLLGQPRVDAEPGAAQAICVTLQGLPLAVEITGQLLAIRTQRRLADMAERLAAAGQRLDLQISDRAVRTSFAVSWEALDAGHRHLFACMAVFAGRSFAAEALAAVAAVSLAVAQDRLDMLAARSLVTAEATGRYRQHPLLADFAGEQLGDGEEPWRRMAQHFGTYAQAHAQDFAALHLEWENLAAGLHLAHARQQWPLVVTYGDALGEAWLAGAYFSEARAGYLRHCEAAASLGDIDAEARGYLRWGRACLEQDDYGEARRLLEMALAAFHRQEEEAGVAEAHTWLARMALEREQYGRAQEHLAICLTMYQALGDTAGLARTRYYQAAVQYNVGDLAATRKLLEHALVAYAETRDARARVPALRLLADVAIDESNLAEAEGLLEEALGVCEATGDRGEGAATRYGLAVVARRRGDLVRGAAQIERAADELARMGAQGFHALALYEQSKILLATGDLERARTLALRALACFEALNKPYNLVYVRCHLGRIEAAAGDAAAAQQHRTAALSMAERLGHPLLATLRAETGEAAAEG